MRIASLLPSATEILYALGLGDQVVGVSHECDYPAEALAKPRLTASLIDSGDLGSAEIDGAVSAAYADGRETYRVEIDLLERLQPDLLVTQDLCVVCAVGGTTVRQAAARLSRPPRILSLEPHSVADVLTCIEEVADATSVAGQGERLVADLQRRLDAVRTATRGIERPRVLCLEWLDPPWIAGHWMPEIVDLAGGLDPLGTAGQPSRRASWDEIADPRPEVVILMPCGFGVERTLSEIDVLREVPQLSETPAFADDRVYAVDGSAYYNRAGPRIVDGVDLLAAILHPELFPARLPPASARRVAWPRGTV